MGLFSSKEETNLDKLQIDKSHWGYPEGFLLEVINEYIDLGYKTPNNCFAYFQELIFKNESKYNILTLDHCKQEIINLVKENANSEEIEKILNSSTVSEEYKELNEKYMSKKDQEKAKINDKATKLNLQYQKDLPIAKKIYSAYVGGIGRLDKINGNILAISSYKLDKIKEQNETLIKQNEEIIRLLSKIVKE